MRTEEDKRQWINKKKRWLEEIEGYLVSVWPGQGAQEKKNKTDALESAFGTRSWTAVEQMQPEQLEEGYLAVQTFAQNKIAEIKGEMEKKEVTPDQKFDQDLEHAKDKGRKPIKSAK